MAPSDVSSFPSIAFSIPDFEGEAILRIFANRTQSEIGCYSAVITNGNSFSHPNSVGTVLGVFTLVAVIASFATAIYGEAVPTMRLHYAHSLSVGVVFAVFQHIFFTGALSVNWPSVLVAWWSNFAWAGGMIYSQSMQESINQLIGNNVGNTSEVGAAQSGTSSTVGGGFDISSIYKRMLGGGSRGIPANHPLNRDIASEIYGRDESLMLRRDVVQQHVQRSLLARDSLVSKSNGYKWYGHPVGDGLPLPGNYSGFAGTLAQEGIRVSNAFMTGFLWLLILLVILVAAVMAFKWALEGMARFKMIKQDRLAFFRNHWLGYSAAVALRTCYIAWFMIMFLTIFQFTYSSSGGVKGVAAIVFIIFLIGIPGAAFYAYYYKKQVVDTESTVERKKIFGVIPWFAVKKNPAAEPLQRGRGGENDQPPDSKSSSKPFWKRLSSNGSFMNSDRNPDNIHDNEDYTMKFGWLTARFRRTRWWFFSVWIFYEFLRAIFYGGASGYPIAQVFGLLVIEFLAFCFIVWARPFEGRRLNVIVVYCLGFSKVASVALSAAFDIQFNLPRITTTAIGIVLIVIQGILTIITMIAIAVGAISSYMSISRNHEDFRPRKWHGLREKYFDHLDRVVNDVPRPPKAKKEKKKKKTETIPEETVVGFEMKGMKRLAKIEDEDKDFTSEMHPAGDANSSYVSLNDRAQTPVNASEPALAGARSGVATPVRVSRTNSMRSMNINMSQSSLPFGARPHRPSWSTRDFSPAERENPEQAFLPIDMSRDVADDEPVLPPSTSKSGQVRTPSRSSMTPNPASAPNTLRPQASHDSLRVGGDVSTRDMIGKVPAPTTRPRAGTHGSLRNSSRRNSDLFPDAPESSQLGSQERQQPQSQRGSRYNAPLMTPAQERDEWTPHSSREDQS